MTALRIDQLEDAINCCKRDCPVREGILPIELRVLADLYGTMIYRGLGSIALGALPPATRSVLKRWGRMEQQ